MLTQSGFLFFHSMVEMFSAIVSAGVFFIAWDTRRFGAFAFFRIVGPAFALVCGLDMLHTLTYKGMGTFPDGTANLPTQLWIAARGTEAVAVLLGVLLAGKVVRPALPLVTVVGYALLLFASLAVWPIFPDCYIEGVGLTRFKIATEYVLIGLKVATLMLLWRQRHYFDDIAVRWLIVYLTLSAASESAFTSYISVYDGMNQLGHILKVAAFVALYGATVKAVLHRPYTTLFRDLESARAGLESAVIARTRELADSEQRLRGLMANVPDAILTIDDHGRIESCNAASGRMFGYAPNELIGKNITTLMAEDIEAQHDGYLTADLATGQEQLIGRGPREVLARRKDGIMVPVDLAVNAMHVEGRRLFIGVLRDISERLKVRRQQAAAEREMMRMQKMESLGSLAGGIAHEVNNMLTPILGLTEVTLLRLPKDAPVRGNLEKVIEAAGRAREILRKMLAFSRVDTSPLVPMPLKALTQEGLPLLRAAMPREVRLTCSLPEGELVARGSRNEFLQVLMNLCGNAAQAVSGIDGRVEIFLDHRQIGPGDGSALPPGTYARLTVRDNGVGIAPEVQDKIFEPFFTTKPVGDGTGMGLAVVHAIIAAWGGGITVETAPGDGATFHVHLPLVGDMEAVLVAG